ncbi:hypothetical protein DSO57_1015957 [Entomophthora muscae]|uniref:Uncharacterized protein n=1 Tax=Entomophthora muscae TaxID=34485 RepID=A0ACC2T4Z8_9FUNG|nr:hypothetical protein DSO57_1015957 [Entomophthora muscae]
MVRESNKVSSQAVGPFDGLQVRTSAGETILLSDMWRKRPVVLKVLARLGCAMCRYEAQALSELQPILEERGVGLVAVVFEDVDLEQFLRCGYWKWDILIDPTRQVYRAAGLVKMGLGKTIKNLLSNQTSKCVSQLEELGFLYNLRGDVRQLGGTFVVDPRGNLLYEFRPSRMAMFPCLRDIVQAIGGDPDDVDENPIHVFTYPTPQVFPRRKSKFDLSL